MRASIETCMIPLPGPDTMHFNSTTSSSRCRSRLLGLFLILCCLTGAILSQTFQYSRGWTNGRKRAAAAPPILIPSSASGTGLFQNTEESSAISNPCSQMQRIRFLLGARNPQQVHGNLMHGCDSKCVRRRMPAACIVATVVTWWEIKQSSDEWRFVAMRGYSVESLIHAEINLHTILRMLIQILSWVWS